MIVYFQFLVWILFFVLYPVNSLLTFHSLSYVRQPLPFLATKVSESWYGDGLAFSCTSCGRCCSGATGSVRFTIDEAEGLATTLDVTMDEFYEQFTRLGNRGRELKEIRMEDGSFDCIFLDRETQPGLALCKVYLNRPLQCKTWPFWPELLEDKDSWEKAASSKYHEKARNVDKKEQAGCPGINKGEKVPYSKITKQLEDTIEWRTKTRRYRY